jgi:hypothetical protein
MKTKDKPKKYSFIMTLLFIVMFLLLSITHNVIAGPPFLTDDPEPVDFQHWELYLASIHTITKDTASGTAPHFECNYGVIQNIQLHVIAPFAYFYSKTTAENSTIKNYGYGDTELGIKIRFLQETAYIPMAGTFPLIELPTGNKNKNLGGGKTQYFLPLWLQKKFGNWQSYGGGGYWVNHGDGNKNFWFFGWQIQREINKKITLGGETFYSTPNQVDSKYHFGINVGGIADFTDNHHFLFSFGRDIRGDDKLIAYIAYQYTI